ncbi:DUF6786 family protein [Pontibacter rufus]|uniref:DUF6786 family protein n=1 Tax=Pontibacter rufus TaxID=2791028 RepID=UPI001E5A2C44|nr:DUF6786 family protein [Pontibacter sp. 172403-2]
MSTQACQPTENKNEEEAGESYATGTFGYDINFLKGQDDSLIVLKDENGESQVIVSAKYQGKVFTSTAGGLDGRSFGWINYEAFSGEKDPHMNAYGGENRFWLGPEGGKFSVFFKPEADMVFDNWVTPASVDTEKWKVLSSSKDKVSLGKETSVTNYIGTPLEIKIKRDIQLLSKAEIADMLGISTDDKVKAVGFKTDNAITNAGDEAWNKETGAPCIWMLDMFSPSPGTVILVPYNEEAEGKVATTDYFGQIPPDRVVYKNGILYFKADGKSRGKLGLPPERAKPVAGSYDPANNVLTVTTFDVENKGTYLNQEWTAEKDPLKGDAVNAYNDGPLEDGSQMGPFYEIESVSPAAFLKPGQTLEHQHNVFHFTGDKPALDKIAQKVFGISLDSVQNAFTE